MGIKVKHTTQATGTYPIEGELGVNEWNAEHEVLDGGEYISADSLITDGYDASALHRSPNAITSMFIYDTSKDSDGGAWTEKCQHTSWYNEPLSGKWLGRQTSELSARLEFGDLGKELLSNTGGPFISTTGWVGNQATLSVENGMLKISATLGSGTYMSGYVALTGLKPFTNYRVTYESISGTTTNSNDAQLYDVGPGSTPISLQAKPGGFVTTGSDGIVWLAFGGTSTGIGSYFYIKYASLKEIIPTTQSNDYFQLTTDGKFYRLYKNLLKYSEDFSNAAWTKAGITTTDPTTLYETSVTSEHFIAQTLSSVIPAGSICTASLRVKSNGRNKIAITYPTIGDAAAAFDLSTGTLLGSLTGSSISASIVPVEGGMYDISMTYSRPTATATGIRLQLLDDTSTGPTIGKSYLGDITKGVFVYRYSDEYGSTATIYEPKTADGSIGEVFRGNKKEFPKLAAVVVELLGVTIYDLTEPDYPMWKIITAQVTASSASYRARVYSSRTYLVTSKGISGKILIGSSNLGGGNPSNGGGLHIFDFVEDTITQRVANYGGDTGSKIPMANYNVNLTLADRHSLPSVYGTAIHDISAAYLEGAPYTATLGLKVPTIALATNGGVSILKHDGTVIGSTMNAAYEFKSVTLTPNLLTAGRTNDYHYYYLTYPGSVSANFFIASVNAFSTSILSTGMDRGLISCGKSEVLSRTILPNSTTVKKLKSFNNKISNSILTTTTNLYNSGCQIGDTKRAYLSDTAIESLYPETLITGTNSTFESSIGDWFGEPTNPSTLERDISIFPNGGLKITTSTASYPAAMLAINTVVGMVYRVKSGINSGSNSAVFLAVANTPVISSRYLTSLGYGADLTFKASASTTYLIIFGSTATVGSYFYIDYVYCYRAEIDRSYKNSHSIPNGTLTKSPVATNAQLVAYSGFSPTNYLQEPYSTDLDFGTGEWIVGSWVNVPTVLPASDTLAVGPEIVLNGDFLSADNWIITSGWTISGGSANANITVADYNQSVLQTLNVRPGARYVITIDITVTSGAVGIMLGASGGGSLGLTSAYYSSGVYTLYGTKSGAEPNTLVIRSNPTFVGSINSISVKEVYPISISDRSHLSGSKISLGIFEDGQLTTTISDGSTLRTVSTMQTKYNTGTWNKAEACYTTDGTLSLRVNGNEVAATRGAPLKSLSSRRNLLSYTEDFSNAVWIKNGLTATKDTITTTSSTSRIYQVVTIAASTNYTYQVKAKPGTANYAIIRAVGFDTQPSAWFDVSTGSVGTVDAGMTAYISGPDIDGFYTCYATFAGSTTDLTGDFSLYPANGNASYNVTIGATLYVKEAQLEVGSTATTYQRVSAIAETEVAPLTIGNSYDLTAPFPGSLALLKLSATVPSTEQSQWMYEQEKHLFREGVQCCLPDSNSVLDLAYDDATDSWTAVSSTNESTWTGLVRTSVKPVPAGSYSKVTSTSGIKLKARITANPGVDIDMPSYSLREKFGEKLTDSEFDIATFDYVGGFTGTTTLGSTSITSVAGISYPTSYVGSVITGTGIPAGAYITSVSGTTIYISAAATATGTAVQISFTDFILPSGHEAAAVRVAGSLKREGSTSDYTRLFDGFKEAVRFATAPGYNVWVHIQTRRSK